MGHGPWAAQESHPSPLPGLPSLGGRQGRGAAWPAALIDPSSRQGRHAPAQAGRPGSKRPPGLPPQDTRPVRSCPRGGRWGSASSSQGQLGHWCVFRKPVKRSPAWGSVLCLPPPGHHWRECDVAATPGRLHRVTRWPCSFVLAHPWEGGALQHRLCRPCPETRALGPEQGKQALHTTARASLDALFLGEGAGCAQLAAWGFQDRV